MDDVYATVKRNWATVRTRRPNADVRALRSSYLHAPIADFRLSVDRRTTL
jgi:hypothetical protein